MPRRQRSTASSLSPLQAHELDVARAARMGIDISHLRPDERCKYPSKFCCHKRARKSTGKLHRFCEEHRLRAQANQKRWTDTRRRHELLRPSTPRRVDVNGSYPVILPKLAPLAIPPLQGVKKDEPTSPTNIDALDDDAVLSEDDIDMLTSIVAECERSSETMTMEDAWLMALLEEVEETAEAKDTTALAMDVLDSL